MAYTKFGEFMRVLRVKNHEVMGDIAKMLGVSVPFLSAVENGKKNVPEDWINKLKSHYILNNVEVNELLNSVEQSKTQMKLDLTKTSSFKRAAALQFARSFEGMDEETALKIMQIFNEDGGND